MALYAGRSLSPLGRQAAEHVSKGVWITWTFVMLLACVGWSLWIIFQINHQAVDRSVILR